MKITTSYWLSAVLLLGLFFSVAELNAKSASGGGGKVTVEVDAEAEAETARQAAEQEAAAAEAKRKADIMEAAQAAAEIGALSNARLEALVEASKAQAEAAVNTLKELDKASPKIAETTSDDVEGDGDLEVDATAEVRICANLDDLRGRITCRMDKTEEALQIELTPENYMPEGCRWGSDTWREKCKVRYRQIHDHYELPLGAPRMEAIKADLGLEAKLKPMSAQCPNNDADCQKTYRAKIEHLIVARFYDAEERAEELFALGKLPEEDLIELVALISEAKVAFYDATKSDDRVDLQREIIEDLRDEWNDYMNDIN